MSISQSIRSFADDAKASLAALDAALGSTAAVALLRRGGALDWADAVIPSADLAVERAMLDAPAAVAGAEGPTRGHADARDELLNTAERGDASGDGVASRGQTMDTTERLAQTGERIKESRRSLLETEDLGVSILQDLQGQRETIERSREALHGADDTISRSRKILSSMGRRARAN